MSTARRAVQFLDKVPPRTADVRGFGNSRSRLAGVKGQREIAEQGLPRPAGGQVDPDAARRLADASAEFEQAGAQGFDLRRAPRRR